MSIVYNTSIVRNGLVLHLDAANIKSYPGTGTTWYDLSGNNNHFQLFNSPTFSANYFNFNGVSNYAKSINTVDLSPYNSVTVEIGFRVNTTVTPSGMAFEHSADWNSQSMGFGLLPNSSGGLDYVANSHHTNQLNGSGILNYTGNIGTDITVHTNVWSRVADIQRVAYINTISQGSKTTGAYPAFRNDTFFLSCRAGSSIFANHRVYFFRVYGKSLSSAEITQNFEAVRGRYGL